MEIENSMKNELRNQRSENVKAVLENSATKTDIEELKVFISELLGDQKRFEIEREHTALALILIYDSLVQKYLWLNDALSASRLGRKEPGREYKVKLMNCFVALAKEVLGLLEKYGVQIFREAKNFDGKRHVAIETKPTSIRERHGKIASVKRRGFVRKRGDDEVVFRPQQVVVYRYTEK